MKESKNRKAKIINKIQKMKMSDFSLSILTAKISSTPTKSTLQAAK